MEGIKEAIAFITDLAVKAEKPETVEINGRTYCTKSLKRYDEADKAEPIHKGKPGGTAGSHDYSGSKRHQSAALLWPAAGAGSRDAL